MSDKINLADVSEETRLKLQNAISGLMAETGLVDYKELSALLRTELRGLTKSLAKAEKKESPEPDNRTRGYIVDRLEIWDVTAGETNADLEHKMPEPVAFAGLGTIIQLVQGAAFTFHNPDPSLPPPDELGYAALDARLPSLRTTLSRDGGHSAWRVRYNINGADYLIYMTVRRDDVEPLAEGENAPEEAEGQEAAVEAAEAPPATPLEEAIANAPDPLMPPPAV